jgi:hypothetical protein
LYFHSIITFAAAFLSVVASIMDLIDRTTKGRKQGSTVHTPRIRPTPPTSVLNLPYGRKPSSKQAVRIPAFPSMDRDMGKLCHSLSDLLYGFSFIINLQAAVAQVKLSTNSSLRLANSPKASSFDR